MKKISAEIVCDSLSPQGHRLTTYVITFPRIVLSEFNTHRMFSRNSASSRAIPTEKMIQMVKDDPFIPTAFQKNHKGMQGNTYITSEDSVGYFRGVYKRLAKGACENAQHLLNNNITKQLANRLLEPFMWHKCIMTAHEIENFFHLRCPQYYIGDDVPVRFRSRFEVLNYLDVADPKKADEWRKELDNDLFWLQKNTGGAEIHISLLAEKMWDAYKMYSTPKQLKAGDWHIPFNDSIIKSKMEEQFGRKIKREEGFEIAIKIAAARCARVSYLNYEGKDDYNADLKLFDRLIIQNPIHASPVEHIAKAMSNKEYNSHIRGRVEIMGANVENKKLVWDGMPKDVCGWSANFRGFIQYRKMFPNENKK